MLTLFSRYFDDIFTIFSRLTIFSRYFQDIFRIFSRHFHDDWKSSFASFQSFASKVVSRENILKISWKCCQHVAHSKLSKTRRKERKIDEVSHVEWVTGCERKKVNERKEEILTVLSLSPYIYGHYTSRDWLKMTACAKKQLSEDETPTG